MDADRQADAIVALLRDAVADLRLVVLFGSRARGDATATSDIDLAVLAERPLSSLGLLALTDSLAERLGTDVHLVDLGTASTVMRSQVLTTGEILYRDGGAELDAFLDFVYADYARLNEERALILRDIRERGSVHGG